MNRLHYVTMKSFFPLALAIALGACDFGPGTKRPELAAQNPAWSTFISAHTAGIVSRKSNVRLVFVNDVVSKDQVGKSANDFVKSSPSIDGSATFASEREILLIPEKELAQGKYYRITLKNKGLAGIPETMEQYEFVFQVIEQRFEVNVAGLSASPKDDTQMLLTGSIVTADTDDAAKVAKVLSAGLKDKTLSVEWQHGGDGKHHDFSISGIERSGDPQTLKLTWDGGPIGVRTKGSRDVEVPARNIFKVTQIQSVRDEQQYVRIYFSDNVDSRQNLKGLIRLSQGRYSVRVEGNAVKIYPERTLEGDVVVTVDAGVKNTKGERLEKAAQETVAFVTEKPKVRFAGRGVILPENDVLSVPIEAVNVRSVQVVAFRVYENNMGQFLQTNQLAGAQELGRVGRYLWRRTIHLTSPESNKWNRYSLDVTKLFKENPSGLFRLTLSINRTNSTFACPGTETDGSETEPPLKSDEDLSMRDVSSWDYSEQYYGITEDGSSWNDRENPCKSAYYRFGTGVRDARNFLASNIGLLAKRDQRGRLLVVATDLRTSEPMKGAKLTAINFQNQAIGTEESNGDGFADIKTSGSPFYLIAEKGNQKGYLKLNQGTALPVSHFDVGGEKVTSGLKGIIYGERGVWRPGDEIFLTFVLQDKDKAIPANHPVTLELRNPKGQLIQTQTNATPVGGFYKFVMKTAEDAPTGDWTAKAVLGGSQFSKTVKVETVMPNRLKVELDFGKAMLKQTDMPLKGKLFGQWLNGATAGGLNADVKASFVPIATKFDRFADFIYDDPAREFKGDPETVFEGSLDSQGYANFTYEPHAGKGVPGMLQATFTSRVFERGGAFSVSRTSLPYSPYASYVGIKFPKGDQARDMLLTDKQHIVEVSSLDADGKPVSLQQVQVTLYKIDWRWWWDKSGESLAQFATASHSSRVQQDEIKTVNGRGQWKFEVKYPAWGRYLVRACDVDGGHCTGKVFYIDWPGWAGRAQEQAGPGANTLTFFADKAEYNVGETAKIQLPEATQGRALITVENGTTILEQQWAEFKKERTRFELPITRAMSPNIYVSVTLIQPHAEKKNDRPIRLYGIIPIKVNDPQTRLKPSVKTANEWAPESNVSVEVSEESGRDMAYTLAVVDEGLLSLTSFKTPELHSHFYKREALGVSTWDLFDDVAGAYGAELERLLALGGSDAVQAEDGQHEKRRFPPVVRFLGPFELKSGATNKHEIKLPPYVGAVRVMVVAGKEAAYGSADKSVFVRQPLMLLPTVSRVVGPEEDLTVPVSLFVMEPSIKEVALKVETDAHFQVVGSDTVTVGFARPDEKLGLVRLKVKPKLGKGTLRFTATSGSHRAKAEVHVDIRSPNPATVQHQRKVIKPGEIWDANIVPHGLNGTNVVSLEMSAVPPLNLERRLGFLIRYPHGCIEQITSAAFPQIYLGSLVKLEDARKKEIERNVQAAVDRLRGFQVPTGGFVYWPGGLYSTAFDARNSWSTNYVGHFLIEADRLGYHVPPSMLAEWVKYQKTAAASWTAGSHGSQLDQAYRLYTLSVAKQPDIGAMNRLREDAQLSGAARWYLAAAYKLAGIDDAATALVKNERAALVDYAHPDVTFGSRLRDGAIVLISALALKRDDVIKPLVDEISSDLSSERWHSTHGLAYSLMAMAKFVGGSDAGSFAFERKVATGANETISVKSPIYTDVLKSFPTAGASVKLKNTSDRTLFGSVIVRGIPKAGTETPSSSGLKLEVSYVDASGNSLDVGQLKQGQDFVARLSVTNLTQTKIDNLALTQIVPSGWEIHNVRLAGGEEQVESSGKAKRRLTSWAAFFSPGRDEPEAELEYLDIRDDRVYRYFGLASGETKSFKTLLNATYLGRYYLPGVSIEAMYDATKESRVVGRWVEVVTPASP